MTAKPHKMSDHFNGLADVYDNYIKKMFLDFDQYYEQVAKPFQETDEVQPILDLGCGTGNELTLLFNKMKHAHITAVDLSAEMLKKLEEKYFSFRDQIDIV